MIALLSVAAAGATWLAPYDPNDIEISQRYAPPLSEGRLLGADDLGRDVQSRLMFAGRISLSVGIAAMLVTLVVGFAVGAFAAYLGGFVDVALMRLTDVMLCFPSVFLLLFVAAFVTPTLASIALMIGLTCWMEIARIVHAQILSLKSADFIAAAQLAGAPAWRIVLRQILPNTLAPLLVAATLEHCQRHPSGKLHKLPRLRHPAAASELGQYADQRAERFPGGRVACGISRPGNHAGRCELQLHRRRIARRARPESTR